MNILATTKDTYNQWAEEKLESFTPKIDDLMVEITNPLNLTKSEKSRIKTLIKNYLIKVNGLAEIIPLPYKFNYFRAGSIIVNVVMTGVRH